MKYTILPNGDLEFSLAADDDRDEVREKARGYNWPWLLEEARMLGNGWDAVAAEWIGALTDAPIVSDGLNLEDDGSCTLAPDARIWWFPNYMVKDPAEELAEHGKVTFTLAR